MRRLGRRSGARFATNGTPVIARSALMRSSQSMRPEGDSAVVKASAARLLRRDPGGHEAASRSAPAGRPDGCRVARTLGSSATIAIVAGRKLDRWELGGADLVARILGGRAVAQDTECSPDATHDFNIVGLATDRVVALEITSAFDPAIVSQLSHRTHDWGGARVNKQSDGRNGPDP